jgi:hypothetical protein
LLTILDQAGWLGPAIDSIRTFGNPPKSLEELQRDVDARKGQPGYDIHHIVEKTPALRDEYPSSKVNGPENLVRIPRLKHWIINAWLETPNENFDWETPRAYMRGKDWDIRYRIGLEALAKFGVLKK